MNTGRLVRVDGSDHPKDIFSMLFRMAFATALLATPLHADGIPTVGDTYEDPLAIIMEAFDYFPSEEEGRPRVQIDASMDRFDRMNIVVTQTGFADDSTAGAREHYVLESGDDGVWTLVYYNSQVLCARGANTVTWQNGGCV